MIKTENLAAVISASKADFLIVIGDRNMKNRSCQAKKAGKLVELQIAEMIDSIWSDWQKLLDAERRDLTVSEGESLTAQQLQLLVHRFCGVKNCKDRLVSLEETYRELLELRSNVSNFDPGYVEQEIALKLSQCLKSLIRLHQQIQEGSAIIKVLPAAAIGPPASRASQGQLVGEDYEPSDKVEDIPGDLQQGLIQFLSSLSEDAERLGDRFGAFGNPLWQVYIQKQQRKRSDPHLIGGDGMLSPNIISFVNSLISRRRGVVAVARWRLAMSKL